MLLEIRILSPSGPNLQNLLSRDNCAKFLSTSTEENQGVPNIDKAYLGLYGLWQEDIDRRVDGIEATSDKEENFL